MVALDPGMLAGLSSMDVSSGIQCQPHTISTHSLANLRSKPSCARAHLPEEILMAFRVNDITDCAAFVALGCREDRFREMCLDALKETRTATSPTSVKIVSACASAKVHADKALKVNAVAKAHCADAPADWTSADVASIAPLDEDSRAILYARQVPQTPHTVSTPVVSLRFLCSRPWLLQWSSSTELRKMSKKVDVNVAGSTIGSHLHVCFLP